MTNNEPSAPLRVGVYTRISQDRHESDSIKRQDTEAQQYARSQGWEVVDTYADHGLSASKKRVKRPQYERLMADARAGVIDAILVWKIDRLTRQPRQIEDLIELVNATGVRLVSMNDPVDTSSETGLLALRMFSAFAAAESGNISLRTRNKAKYRAMEGKPAGGGVRPYGHSPDWLELVDDEANAIRDAVREVLRGGRVYSIATRWNSEGRRTVLGKLWRSSNLRQMLMQPRLAGLREVDAERYSGGFPAIITEGQHDRVVEALTDATRTNHRDRNVRYVLTGILWCHCGSRMSSGGKDSRGGMIYRCPQQAIGGGCGKVSLNGQKAEAQVFEALIAQIERQIRENAESDGSAEHAEAELTTLSAAIGAVDRRLEALVQAHFLEGIIDRAHYVSAKTTLDEQLHQLRADYERVEAATRVTMPDQLGPNLREVTTDERRQILHAMIDRITVLPANKTGRYDPQRLDIRWVWDTNRWLPNLMAKQLAAGVRLAKLEDYVSQGDGDAA
jgi:site-specific DNA recombinase